MFNAQHHITRASLGFSPATSRTVTPVPAWALALVPRPENVTTHIKENETVEGDTIPLIKQIVRETLNQTKKLAAKLKASTLKETLRNNTNFILKHIRYKKDAAGKEQVREPARLVWDGVGDCDCFAVFLSSLLTNQKIGYSFRIMKQNGASHWSHIYIVVPKPGGGYYTLDPVTNEFNSEPSFTEKKDFNMALERLSGFDCTPGMLGQTEINRCRPFAKTVSTYVDTTSVEMENLVPTKKFLDQKGIAYSEVKTDTNATVLVVETSQGQQVAVPTIINKQQAQQLETAVQQNATPQIQTQAQDVAPKQARFGWLLALLLGGGLLMAKKDVAKTAVGMGNLNGPVKRKSSSKTKKYKTLHL